MWSVIFSALIALSLVCSVAAAWFSVRNAGRVWELQRSLSALRPLAAQSLETRLTELEESLSILANRVKMTKVRNAAMHLERDKGGEPDAKSDPEAWRTWKNAQLQVGTFNQ